MVFIEAGLCIGRQLCQISQGQDSKQQRHVQTSQFSLNIICDFVFDGENINQ
jgi:hypothetical protein